MRARLALERIGEDRYRAALTVALAAITGSYEGTVQITEKVANQSYRLTVEGQGKPGFVKGNAAITMRPDGATTIVDVAGTVETGGPTARLGQRLTGNVSKMMQDRFFAVRHGATSAPCLRPAPHRGRSYNGDSGVWQIQTTGLTLRQLANQHWDFAAT